MSALKLHLKVISWWFFFSNYDAIMLKLICTTNAASILAAIFNCIEIYLPINPLTLLLIINVIYTGTTSKCKDGKAENLSIKCIKNRRDPISQG